MFRRIKKLLSRVLRPRDKREPEAPRGPYSNRLAPVRRGPRGRSGAAAVAEPDEE